jgi:large subunit ribosomal protein L7/L12
VSNTKIEKLLDNISELTVLEVCDLVKAMEQKFGVSAAAPVAAAAAPAAAQAEEQTEFDVHLNNFGEKKIEVIKGVRELLGLGLKEAKDLVESAPCVVKAGVSKDEAAKIQALLAAAGATIDVK